MQTHNEFYKRWGKRASDLTAASIGLVLCLLVVCGEIGLRVLRRTLIKVRIKLRTKTNITTTTIPLRSRPPYCRLGLYC